MLHVSGKAGRKSDESLAVLPQNFLVYARLVVIAFYVAYGNDFYEVLVPNLIFSQEHQMSLMLILVGFLIRQLSRRSIDLAAYYGLDSLLFTFFIKIYHAEHRAVVCDGKAVHAQFFGMAYKISYPRRTVKQAVFSMNMQMCKCHIAISFLIFYHSSRFFKSSVWQKKQALFERSLKENAGSV